MKRFTGEASGATSIEYALLAALIAIVVVSAITAIGTNVNTMIISAANGFK